MRQIYVNFEGSVCICFCNEGQTIAYALSLMLCSEKIESLEQEKKQLQAEKKQLQAQTEASIHASFVDSIREKDASIREKDASIREIKASIVAKQVLPDPSLNCMQIYSATGRTLQLCTKLDKTLIDESCSSTKPITVTKEGELCTFRHNGGDTCQLCFYLQLHSHPQSD